MKRAVVYAAMAGAAWGVVILSPKLLTDFSPLLLSCGRFVLYGIVSFILLLPNLASTLESLQKCDVVVLLKLALAGNLVYFMLLAAAIQWVGIATASLIIGVLPVTIALAGRNEADTVPLKKIVLPLLLICTAIVCINIDAFRARATALEGHEVVGLLCAFGALGCWTWFATRNAQYLRTSKFSSAQWSGLWGITTGVLAAILWLVAALIPLDATRPEVGRDRWALFWCLSLLCAVLGSWLGNQLWNASTRRVPLSLSGQLIVFETLFALVYGFAWMRRWPTLIEASAIVLLISGVLLAVRRFSRPVMSARAGKQI